MVEDLNYYISPWAADNSSSSTSNIYYDASTSSSYSVYTLTTADATTIQDQWIRNIVTDYRKKNSTTGWYIGEDYTSTTTNNNYWVDDEWRVYKSQIVQPTPSERLRGIIQSRQAPLIIGTRKPVQLTKDPKEVRARETLLRVLGEDKFRGFLRNGFVSVRGKSGKVYQIFPGHDITKVYQNGQMVERLCVVLSGSFPPTDALIMRFLLILNDEEEFRSYAIKHSVTPRRRNEIVVDMRPLPEIYKSLLAA
jgi:hypothetical protein